MRKGRAWLSGQHDGGDGIGAALRDAYSVNDLAADRRMQDLVEQMKAIEARPKPRTR
jgi:hypothetical protein